MKSNEQIIQEYEAQSRAAKDELLRLQAERDAEIRAASDRAVLLNECAWRDYSERMTDLRARRRRTMALLKMYLDTSTDDADTKARTVEERHAELSDLQTAMDELKGEYHRKVREIADNRKTETVSARRHLDFKIEEQHAIIRALRDAFLKRINFNH